MNDTPTHATKSFQFSLLTALIGTVLLGLVLKLNLPYQVMTSGGTEYYWGWPLATMEQYSPDTSELVVTYTINLIAILLFVFLIWAVTSVYKLRRDIKNLAKYETSRN